MKYLFGKQSAKWEVYVRYGATTPHGWGGSCLLRPPAVFHHLSIISWPSSWNWRDARPFVLNWRKVFKKRCERRQFTFCTRESFTACFILTSNVHLDLLLQKGFAKKEMLLTLSARSLIICWKKFPWREKNYFSASCTVSSKLFPKLPANSIPGQHVPKCKWAAVIHNCNKLSQSWVIWL